MYLSLKKMHLSLLTFQVNNINRYYRMFSKSFTIANDVEVKGAELKDGLLKISMERIIPEHKKAKLIDIK